MFYLNDGIDEYLANKGSFSYANEYSTACTSEDDYNTCISACGYNESCIDGCVDNYQCDNIITCIQDAQIVLVDWKNRLALMVKTILF